jgi:hypothetical protein
VRSADYNKIMGTGIVGDNQAVDNYSLTNGSDYRAAGLNASVTSFRADWVLIDDPVKGREDADSDLIREKTWSTLTDDVFTRMKPNAKIVIAMTRWHEDDIAGRILGEKWKGQSGFWRGTDGRLWLVINLPLLAEHADDPLKRKVGQPRRVAPRRARGRAFISSVRRRTTALFSRNPTGGHGPRRTFPNAIIFISSTTRPSRKTSRTTRRR